MDIGHRWNESRCERDPLTGREIRLLSTTGRINQTPTYHTGSGFTHDGRYLVFVSVRNGATDVLRAELATGELTLLWRAPGIGDRNYLHRGMGLAFDDVDGRGICGNRVCVVPKRQLAVFCCERSLYAVDLHSCEARVLIADIGARRIFGAPCVDPDERHVAIALSSAHPELAAGEPATRSYTEFPDHCLELVRVPLDGGEMELLYRHQPAQSAHCAFCPSDGDLLYFDRDLPPGYWGGGDGCTPRIWLLDLRSGEARPLKRDFPGPFQTHQAWLWDGSALAYHSHGLWNADRSGTRPGFYLGVTAVDGTTRWEYRSERPGHYGHLSPDPRHPALIVDGDFSDDLLQWCYYDGPDGAEPRLEPICVHGSEWGSLPGQYSHPHPLCDRGGRWISFTRARGGRSDVCVVDVDSV